MFVENFHMQSPFSTMFSARMNFIIYFDGEFFLVLERSMDATLGSGVEFSSGAENGNVVVSDDEHRKKGEKLRRRL